MLISLAPIINAAISVAATVLLALGSVAVHKLNKWLEAKTGQQDLLNEEQIRTTLHQALDNGVAYASTKVDSASVDVKSQTIQHAIEYVNQHAPDAVAHFNLDEGGLEQLLLAKLAQRGSAT